MHILLREVVPQIPLRQLRLPVLDRGFCLLEREIRTRHVQRFPDPLPEHISQPPARQRLDHVGQHHVHHVAVLPLRPDFPRHGQMSQTPDYIPETESLAAVTGVVAGHTRAMGPSVFERDVRGGVFVGEDEVVADEG